MSLGDTIWFLRDSFSRLYTIEISPLLAELAVARFKRCQHVRVIQGDSARMLPGIIKEIQEPTLFWLDGHHSAGLTGGAQQDSPIRQEIDAIFSLAEFPFAVLMDDARCFGSEKGYPSLVELEQRIRAYAPHASWSVENDIIRVVCLNTRQ